jgi:hypothetical protein
MKDAGLGNNPNQDVVHETLEAYLGAKNSPGSNPESSFDASHNGAIAVEPSVGTVPMTQYENEVGEFGMMSNDGTKRYSVGNNRTPNTVNSNDIISATRIGHSSERVRNVNSTGMKQMAVQPLQPTITRPAY